MIRGNGVHGVPALALFSTLVVVIEEFWFFLLDDDVFDWFVALIYGRLLAASM